ncbi:aspartyl/asparaginyl beta-hydroxylase domain-containing protein [Photobacterium rosenbergii]|uniref:Aspartyl/asparaginyl beta-hydroxylase domain-containing protein n=1 Tax=Photobacterium rosenbergii TaxID=294936 RepID=A0ABU3ZR91_9GAMM|nr:aspartyl/asparaginyl beta-hydroxylase domain-containing protein [Photobacterium rosenbergii]MDV5172538.1 aspartyl/asparaginyl beta-hydroxylase domain-containing protein [Photobacterium rosenbergii]
MDVIFSQLSLPDAPVLTDSRWCDSNRNDDSRWLSHVNKACFEGNWSVLPLRGLMKHAGQSPILQAFNFEETASPDDYQNYPVLRDEFPCLERFLQLFPCSVLSARLMRLDPGSEIKPHRDSGLDISNGQARLHYCLRSDPGVEFMVSDQLLRIAEGELWYINAAAEHAVYHRGHTPRIHLVFDCIVNDWLMAQLQPKTEHEER